MKNCIFAVLVLILCLPIVTPAQQSVNGASLGAVARITPEENLAAAVDAPAAGVAEGTGTHFDLTNSGYLDVVLDSSETVDVRLTSSPELVTLHLEASADKASTLITLGGFKPSTTYFKYEDNYHNREQFTTDDAGVYTFQQDISSAHFVYIQPRKSTKFISDNATGGDCAAIGIWDAAAKTCTLTMDLNETVQIDSDNITLDGNGHTITGTGTGFGIYLPGRTGVTVRGARVSSFGDGIYLRLSSGCTISGNTVSANTAGPYYGGGIQLDSSSNNTVTGNTSMNNANCGISLTNSNANTVTNNIATGNGVGYRTGYSWTNTFSGNVAENNGTGYMLWGVNNRSDQLNNLFENNIARSNAGVGIHINASYTILRANTVSGNDIGIDMALIASHNTFRDNIVQENRTQDVIFGWSWFNNGAYGMISGGTDCTNTFENTTGSGGRPIKLFNSAVDLRNEVLAGLILCNADGSTISDVTIAGSDTLNNNGLILMRTENTTIRNIVSSDNRTGIYLAQSSNNVIENVVTNANEDGIRLSWSSSGNTVRNNSMNGNTRSGIYIHHGSNENITITGNTIANSLYGVIAEMTTNSSVAGNTVTNTTGGMMLYSVQNSSFTKNTFRTSAYPLDIRSSSGNLIYNNSFIDYAAPQYTASSGNTFNLDRPIGGNYWSRFDTPSEGCSDLDQDGFCDAAYDLGGGVDYLPWASQDGWVVPVDTTAPSTTMMISGMTGDNGWYRSPVQVTLTATDNDGGSGVKEVRYTMEGGETIVPGSIASFTLSAEGVHQLAYFAKDNAGNSESPHPLTVSIDMTVPSVTAAGTTAPNAAGWNNSDVLAAFTCTDALSGIASCTEAAVVTAEGAGQVVTGAASDLAGNAASVSLVLNIDKTAPVTAATLSGTPGAVCRNADVLVTLAGSDALSGVAATQYRVNGGAWQSYSAAFTLSAEGAYMIGYRSIDLAGNAEAEKIVGFTIDKTAPEALIRFDAASREIKVYDGETGAEASYTVVPVRQGNEEMEDDDHEDSRHLDGECERHDEEGGHRRELRQYTLTDCAGNMLVLTLVYKKEGHEVRASVVSMKYSDGAVIDAARNRIRAEYAVAKDGTIKELEQKVKVGETFNVMSRYSVRKGESRITEVLRGQMKKETRPGMTILELVTGAGRLLGRY